MKHGHASSTSCPMLQLCRVTSLHAIRQSHGCLSGSMHCGERHVVIMFLMPIQCHSIADLCRVHAHVVSVFNNTAVDSQCVQTISHPHRCSSLSFQEIRCGHVPIEVCLLSVNSLIPSRVKFVLPIDFGFKQ